MSKMQYLMCEPNHYDVRYSINPFMQMDNPVNLPLAKRQWENLVSKISLCGGEVQLIEGAPENPDMVFTSNAGLIYQNNFIPSNFAYKERWGERELYCEYFREKKYNILDDKDAINYKFEGDAEVVQFDDYWFIAVGPRSEISFYEKNSFFKDKNYIFCQLISDHFYHLDTCLLYLSDGIGLWYPEAFSLKSQYELTKYFNLYSIPKSEALKLACNAVVINNKIIMPSGCDFSKNLLERLGYIVYSTDMSEFIKSGGACHCLTLKIGYHS